MLAWLNFLLTGKWASLPGALNGWRQPWYAAALLAATALTLTTRRQVGAPTRIGRTLSLTPLVAGAAILVAALFSRLPLSPGHKFHSKTTTRRSTRRRSMASSCWSEEALSAGIGGCSGGTRPRTTSRKASACSPSFRCNLRQSLGYRVLHAVVFLAIPAFVWWDVRQDNREAGLLAGGFACFLTAGYFATIGNSGDTNSLLGVFCAGLALVGSRAARLGRRWGGPVLMLGLTLALYSHVAFCVYAGLYLLLESAYYRDAKAFLRLAAAGVFAVIVSLPVHWESLRYPTYVSFNNTVYNPGAPLDWPLAVRTIYYNVEMLALPHRWFNDYRSLANLWLPVLVVMAFSSGPLARRFLRLRRRADAGVAPPEHVGGGCAVRSHPAHDSAARWPCARRLRVALRRHTQAGAGARRRDCLFVATSFVPVRHVPELRAFDPPLIDRIAASDGNMILVEISPHRDIDSDPQRRSVRTPFDVHFEGLLPGVAGQRFYSQMWDGWIWSVLRGQVVGAGTFAGQAIEETPPAAFVAEMRRWGVRHLFVWTDASREYLAGSGFFAERWRSGPMVALRTRG